MGHNVLLSILLFSPVVLAIIPQTTIPLVETFPSTPSPWTPVDWRDVAEESISFMFNASVEGLFLPLYWTEVNATSGLEGFGLPSYVGQATGNGASKESIACAAAVLSAALLGRNVSCLMTHSDGPTVGDGSGTPSSSCMDVERALLQFYDGAVSGIFTDRIGQANMSFWYAGWVNMLPVMVASSSRSGALLTALRNSSLAWLRVEAALGAPLNLTFNYSGVNFAPDGTPIGVIGDTHDYPLPVTSAGVAWLLYATRSALGEDSDPDAPALLAGAENALAYLFSVPYNCYWEVLLPYGAVLSARLNAEQGRAYNTSALLNYILQDDLPSHYPYRWGWGTIAQSWAGIDVYGLTGAVSDRDGYAFTMDTLGTMAGLLPIARYEAQFARALGRYGSNAANAARLFFPRFNAPNQQSDWDWVLAAGAAATGADVLAYEGLRHYGFNATDPNITGPYATGDGVAQDGLPTNIAVYGGAYVGILAALIVPLADAPPVGLAAFNITATDYFSRPTHPTTLVYNGASSPSTFSLPLPQVNGGATWDVYDAVSQAIVATDAAPPTVSLTLGADIAAVLVVYASGASITRDEAHNWLLADGIVIDWQLSAH